jgi:hypothetical protein
MRLSLAPITGLVFSLLLNPAWSAESCVSPSDAMALKTAAVQQQLMVAAFMCRDNNAYNQFVRTHQTALQESDASLKSYFVHRLGRRGEAAYDTYKTKVANLSGLSQAKNSSAFCGEADRLFAQARSGSLSEFVEEAPPPPGFRKLCVKAPVQVRRFAQSSNAR